METKKLLVCVLSYNAENFILDTLKRIPKSLKKFNTQVLILDDASTDSSFELVSKFKKSIYPFNITNLQNKVNQGMGGNVKIGITYAIENKFDVIAFTHADGQYPPELIYDYAPIVLDGSYSTVFGSRMYDKRSALKGGMPMYKFFGNIFLTMFQNFFLSTKFTEFHTGFRIYSIEALKKVPFEIASNYFNFDIDLTFQFLNAGLTIKEMPIPTKYGEEKSRVNVFYYGLLILYSTIIFWAHKRKIINHKKYVTHANIQLREKLKKILDEAKR